MRRGGLIALIGCMILAAGPSMAGGQKPARESTKGFAVRGDHPVTAQLLAEHTSLPSRGQTRVGVYFQLEEGWHIYAADPGDAGLPTKVTWESLPGVLFGPLVWPPAKELLDPGDIRTFGYIASVMLTSTLSYVARKSVPELPITAHVNWLACREICIPGSAELHLSLPMSSAPPARSPNAELFP